MKRLLNTLYIVNEMNYLSLDGENVVVKNEGKEVGRVPLHNLEAIVCMNYVGASPALMGKCAQYNIGLSFVKPTGQFMARVSGPAYGNILLRKRLYQLTEQKEQALEYSRNFILGKLYNSRGVIQRAMRDYAMRLDCDKLKNVSENIYEQIAQVKKAESIDEIRGYEGEAAKWYFSVFDDLILQQKENFSFHGRSRRPPLDEVNAMLSFAYTLLESMCCAALETVGLDPYAGFMHTDRPGRHSLALDVMEELRAVFADRFVLSLINKKEIKGKDFQRKEDGAVLMNESARSKFITAWQRKKQEQILHPYLEEKIEWGMVPYVQALLLARAIRGDIDGYPPFFWK
ncbi:MAG: type I-C CRISPR-associated endonuclease Cas1 [Lachnospiraceae bacterium]|nr:type I-C CRISPR-associated endonuclease Cas1 [Lachnospiraceae bacterium]